jgi:hypothetical protein
MALVCLIRMYHACRYLGARVQLYNVSDANFIHWNLYNFSIPPQSDMCIVLLFLKATKLQLLFVVIDCCDAPDDQAGQQYSKPFHPLYAVSFFLTLRYF